MRTAPVPDAWWGYPNDELKAGCLALYLPQRTQDCRRDSGVLVPCAWTHSAAGGWARRTEKSLARCATASCRACSMGWRPNYRRCRLEPGSGLKCQNHRDRQPRMHDRLQRHVRIPVIRRTIEVVGVRASLQCAENFKASREGRVPQFLSGPNSPALSRTTATPVVHTLVHLRRYNAAPDGKSQAHPAHLE